jgi:nitrite reductase/ring-hydroxylating ferredoxin subunit
MGTYIKGARQGELAAGAGKLVEAQGKSIALLYTGGHYFALDNECTHVGGSLCEGTISGDEVICPWHAARFDLRTGEVRGGPARHSVNSYPVRLQGDDVEIEI